jgi:hypothetical protein
MKPSKLFLFVTALAAFVSIQNTSPVLADGAGAPQPVSHGQRGAISSLSGVTAKTCYPQFGQCTKDSDCCTGYCRVGRVYAYCDYGK